MEKIPVVLAAFGSLETNRETLLFIEKCFKEKFPDLSFYWAFASRKIQDKDKERLAASPETLLMELADKGCKKTIIQSLHISCAREFHKLIPIAEKAPLETKISLPLLSSMRDCREAVLALKETIEGYPEDRAIVLAFHGSSHPGGIFFHIMGKLFKEIWGNRGFYAMIEGEPDGKTTAAEIKEAGFSKALVIPFTLMTGKHFRRDLKGEKNSWKEYFLKEGIESDFYNKGLGQNKAFIDIFCRHLKESMEQL